jgi:hypothetical protein
VLAPLLVVHRLGIPLGILRPVVLVVALLAVLCVGVRLQNHQGTCSLVVSGDSFLLYLVEGPVCLVLPL